MTREEIDSDHDDRCFNALLGEALGGGAAPDLSQQILRALAQQQAVANLENVAETALADHSNNRLAHAMAAEPLLAGPPPVISDSGSFVCVSKEEAKAALAKHPQGSLGTSSTQKSSVLARRSDRASAQWLIAIAAGILLAFGAYGAWTAGRVTRDSLADETTSPANVADDQVARTSGDPQSGSDITQQFAGTSNGTDANIRTDVVRNHGSEDGLETARVRPPRTLEGPNFSGHPNDSGGQAVSIVTSIPVHPTAPAKQADTEILARVDGDLERYWESLGVGIPDETDSVTLANRLSDLLGRPVDLSTMGAGQAVQQALDHPETRQMLARRLVAQLLGRVGRGRLSASQHEALANVIAPAFGGGQRYDEIVGELLTARGSIDPESPQFQPATLWYGALAGPRSVPLVEQFASTMLDVDLRCGRCHDHPLDGRVEQDQYWQLTAMFETGLRWTAGGNGDLRLEGAPSGAASDPPVVFYELRDGRQRAAQPRPPLAWVVDRRTKVDKGLEQATSQISSPEAVDWLASSLRDNPQLARAAVNNVWAVVYGRPLVGSAADPAAAPESTVTVALRDHLAEQLRAHDFDLGRLLAWVASARPMRAEVPETLRTPQFEMASNEALQDVSNSVRAFAAFPHCIPQQGMSDLLAIASPVMLEAERLPRNLDGVGGTAALAQIGATVPAPSGSSSDAKREPTAAQLLKASLQSKIETRASGQLPTVWLEKVGGEHAFQRRAEHLYYLAGYWHPSAQQMEVARLLRGGVEDDAEALARLWWILEHQR